jgi:pyruvate carboxylase subunit B
VRACFPRTICPCVEFAAKECGIRHLEAGGGAMFQSPYFYSRENAFDVMDAFRKAAGPDADLQTLARGISVVALKAQPQATSSSCTPDMFKKHGMTTIRNFDALNDVQQSDLERPVHPQRGAEARSGGDDDGTAARLLRRA